MAKRSADGWKPLDKLIPDKSARQRRRYCQQGLRHSKIGQVIYVHEDDWAAFLETHARGRIAWRASGSLTSRRAPVA
jgi:hypothetical protein